VNRTAAQGGVMKLQQAEAEALENCGLLLQFAAEQRKQSELREDVVSTITQALELSESDQWNPDVAKNFWLRYSELCALIQPATAETIRANLSGQSRRVARFYIWALAVLLFAVVVFGYLASSADVLTREIRTLMTEADKIVTQVRGDIDGLQSEIARLMADDKTKNNFSLGQNFLDQDLVETPLPAESVLRVTQLREHLQSLYYYSDTMHQKIQALSVIFPLVPSFSNYDKGDLTPVGRLDGHWIMSQAITRTGGSLTKGCNLRGVGRHFITRWSRFFLAPWAPALMGPG
jgi:hypothetical protein